MRKILLFVFLLFFIDFSFSQLITNGNFENWQVVNHYEVPDDWFIINDIDNANNLAEKSFDAQQGLISVKLNTIATQDDTLFGLVMYGEANDGIFKGKPFSQLGDNFHFWYKSNLSSGDMGMMLMMLYKNGAVIDSIVYIFNSNHVYWTEIILPVNPSQIQPDSMFLTFLSSIPEDFGGNPKPGSWLMIDNMFFTLGGNPTPLTPPNYSFESWSMTSTEEALPWVSSNAQNNLLINDVVNVVKTNNSNTGTYAAELSTVNISGVKTIGNIQYSESVNSQPEKLNLFYKFTPDGIDTAFINIVFLKNQNAVGGGYYEIFTQNSNFVELNIDLNYTDYPDEFNLSILNGKNQGSVLIVDDVHFDCIKPQHFFAEFTSSTAALLSWNNGGFEDEWQIQWGLEGFTMGTGNYVSVSAQTSYNLTNIDDINKYDLYIRAVCGTGDTSNWVGPFTLCKSTNVPLDMDFENSPLLEVPSCWYSYDNN